MRFAICMSAALLPLIGAGCDRRGSAEGGMADDRAIPDSAAHASPNPLERPPIDDAKISLVDAATSWKYRREASADLDGDGAAERVVLASDVTIGADSAALWEDGHRWALFVEAADGERTLLYGAFVPMGMAEAAIAAPDDRSRRRVLVQERGPSQLRTFEIEYNRPGSVRLSSAAYYQIEQWLPGNASLR